MTFWSELFVGDAKSLAEAYEDQDLGPGTPGVAGYLDLPSILPEEDIPNSPYLLTELASEHADGTMGFDSGRARTIAEGGEHGAYVMADEWVLLFAGLGESQIDKIGRAWSKECGFGASAEGLIDLVRDISTLCSRARTDSQDVIYTWTL